MGLIIIVVAFRHRLLRMVCFTLQCIFSTKQTLERIVRRGGAQQGSRRKVKQNRTSRSRRRS